MGSSSEIQQREKPQDAHIEVSSERPGEIPLDIKPMGMTDAIMMENKDHMNFDRVDKEVAEYAAGAQVAVDPETDKRLKKMIDRRVLVIMIITYFLQALDKGTISFTSIMKMPEDLHLEDQQVSFPNSERQG